MLKKFEGHDVIGAAIKVTRAGDGLSEALSLAPESFKPGDRIALIIEGEIVDITYKGVKDSDALKRVHVLKTERAVRINADVAGEYFTEEADRLRALREEADGVVQLPMGDDPLNVFGGQDTPTAEQAAAEGQAAADEAAG